MGCSGPIVYNFRLWFWGPNQALKPPPSCLGALFFYDPFLRQVQGRSEKEKPAFHMGRLSKSKVRAHAKKYEHLTPQNGTLKP